MSIRSEFEENNKLYAQSFSKEKAQLPLPPGKKIAILACMDARLDPAKILGLNEGDAHVIRNAGGRGFDGLRSIIISQRLLGTREIIIIHHTDCGMLTFTDDELRGQLARETGQITDHFSFLAFKDLERSVKDDYELLKTNVYVLDVPITGYVYDVTTGILKRVV